MPGFAETYLIDGTDPKPGARLAQTALAQTLQHLADNGLRSFYDDPPTRTHAAFLEANGNPLREGDFAANSAQQVTPLTLETSQGQLFNMVAPTQGVASLSILGLFDRLGATEGEGFGPLHTSCPVRHGPSGSDHRAPLAVGQNLGG